MAPARSLDIVPISSCLSHSGGGGGGGGAGGGGSVCCHSNHVDSCGQGSAHTVSWTKRNSTPKGRDFWHHRLCTWEKEKRVVVCAHKHKHKKHFWVVSYCLLFLQARLESCLLSSWLFPPNFLKLRQLQNPVYTTLFLFLLCSLYVLFAVDIPCILFVFIYDYLSRWWHYQTNVNVTSHWPASCGRSSGLYIGMIDCRIGFWVIETIFLKQQKKKVNIKFKKRWHVLLLGH